MSKKSYGEADDSAFHDRPEAPKSNRACRTGANDPFPVMDDEKPMEDPVRPGMDDTDRQIRRDEEDFMDKSNVMRGRSRHAKPRHNYQEGVDESLGLDYRDE